MGKHVPEPPRKRNPSQKTVFRVLSEDSKQEILALARALARDAVDEYLEEARQETQ